MSSFWDSLDQTVKSIGGAVAAPIGATIDLASHAFHGDTNFGDYVDILAKHAQDSLDPLMNNNTLTGMGFGSVMHGLDVAYREGVSEPVSTFEIMGHHALYDGGANWQDIFSGQKWSQAYDVAQHRSIGQEAFVGYRDQTQNVPLWKQFLGISGSSAPDPLQQRAYNQIHAQNKLGSSLFSGTVDFTSRWYLDPGVVLGKAGAAFREGYKGAKILEADHALGINKILSGEVKAQHGFTPFSPGGMGQAIGRKFAGNDLRTRTEDLKDWWRTGADGAPMNSTQIFVGTDAFRAAPNGRQLAGLVEDALKIQDKAVQDSQLNRILSVAYGDKVEALNASDELRQTAAISDELKNIAKGNVVDLKTSALGDQIMANPVLFASLQGQLDNMDAVTEAVDNHVRRLELLVGKSGDTESMDAGGLFNTVKGAAGVTAKGKRAVGRELGHGLLRDGSLNTGRGIDKPAGYLAEQAARFAKRPVVESVFQKSQTSVPLRILTHTALGYARMPQKFTDALRQVHFNGMANLHEWESAQTQLDAMMRRAGVDNNTRWGHLSEASGLTTEAQKQALIEKVEHDSIMALAEKHGIVPEAKAAAEAKGENYGPQYLRDYVSQIVKNGQDKRAVFMAPRGGRAYGATLYDDPLRANSAGHLTDAATARLRVDQKITGMDENNIPVTITSPLLQTQLANYIPLVDIDHIDKILGRHSGFFAQHAKAWANMRGDLTAWQKAQKFAGNQEKWLRAGQSAMDWLVENGTRAMRAWKYSVLFRLGYPMRIVLDDHSRIWSQIGAGVFYGPNLSEAISNAKYNVFDRRGQAKVAMAALKAERDQLAPLVDDESVAIWNARDADIRRFNERIDALTKAAQRAEKRDRTRLSNKMRAQIEATGEDLYHGTPHQFDKFDDSRAVSRGGSARYRADGKRNLYFTRSKSVAQKFAYESGGVEMFSHSQLLHGLNDSMPQADLAAGVRENIRSHMREGDKIAYTDWDGKWHTANSASDIPDDLLLEQSQDGAEGLGIVRKGMNPRVIKTKVYGKTLDLRNGEMPEDLRRTLQAEGKWTPGEGSTWDHESSAELVRWAREHGYGKIRVKDAHESGFESTIAVPEFIGHNRDVVTEQVEKALSQADFKSAAAAARKKARQLAQGRDALQAMQDSPPQAIQARINEIDDLIQRGTKAIRKGIAKKHVGQQGVELFDGTVAHAPFEGEQGDAWRRRTSSNHMWEQNLAVGEEKMHRLLTSEGGYGTIAPSVNEEYKHLHAWADVLNHQFRQSPEAMHFINGGDVEGFVRWLKEPGQKTLRERLPHYANDPEDWGHRIEALVDDYLGSDAIRKAVQNGKVTPEQLKRLWPDVHTRPTVHGAGVSHNLGNSRAARHTGAVMNRLDRWFKWMSEDATDNLTRHPYFAALYRSELNDMYAREIAQLKGAGREFTQDDLRLLENAARKRALNGMRRTLFDIESHSNAAHMLRFISPFFAAHQEAVTRWWRIVSENPEILRRFQQTFDMPKKLGLVVDQNGNPVPDGKMVGSNQYLLLRLPPAWGGGPIDPSDPNFKGQAKWKISLNSFNLILQSGSPLNPGIGPVVAVPAEALLHKLADHKALENLVRLINPYPSDSALGQLYPATIKRAYTLLRREHSNEFMYMWANNFQDELVQWREAHPGGVQPNKTEQANIWERAKKQTLLDAWLRLGQNFLSPFPANPGSRYEAVRAGWTKILQQMQAQGKDYNWAIDQFQSKYGEAFFPLTNSSSNNVANLPVTNRAVGAVKEYRGILNKVDPSLAGGIIGPIAGYTKGRAYSQAASTYLRNTTVAPGSSATYISTDDPQQQFIHGAVQEGWQKYSDMTASLQVMAQNQGLETWRQSTYLTALKDRAVTLLENQNPYWGQAYTEGISNPQAFQYTLKDLQTVVSDKKLADDPARTDIQALGTYLQLRQMFANALAQRAAQGGASTMSAQANADLQAKYIYYFGKLEESNLDFQRYWADQVLYKDPFLQTTNPKLVAAEQTAAGR